MNQQTEKGTPLWRALLLEHRLPWRYKKFIRDTIERNNSLIKILRLIRKDLDFFYDEAFATSPCQNKVFAKGYCEIFNAGI